MKETHCSFPNITKVGRGEKERKSATACAKKQAVLTRLSIRKCRGAAYSANSNRRVSTKFAESTLTGTKLKFKNMEDIIVYDIIVMAISLLLGIASLIGLFYAWHCIFGVATYALIFICAYREFSRVTDKQNKRK
jgi:hypothetical protein